MASQNKNKKKPTFPSLRSCANPRCFFCAMEEPNPSLRSPALANCFRQLPLEDRPENILVLSSLWSIAMAHPDDPEFPSLGIFRSMASLIRKAVSDRDWLLRDQNVYVPYYAAHVVGSYTMNRPDFAERAVESGVVPVLVELMRGKNVGWVEQRAAVRALGHIASYDRTFEEVADREAEVVRLAMHLASTCVADVHISFVGAKKRPKYQRNLLTGGGVRGRRSENRKAEEWAGQLRRWSLYILNCFACRRRALTRICQQDFLAQLPGMNRIGVGLLRILCYTKTGRERVSGSKRVVGSLCNLSRTSLPWQYMGIDCLVLLLKDPDARHAVIRTAAPFLVDLVELRSLGRRSNVGMTIARALLLDFHCSKANDSDSKSKDEKNGTEKALQEVRELNEERRKREGNFSKEQVFDKMESANAMKRDANEAFRSGRVAEAAEKYSRALGVCPLRMRKERAVLYRNRAQCHLLLRDAGSVVRDATRALCLCSPANTHAKSLWRRSQAYEMKGMAKESLADYTMLVKTCRSNINHDNNS